MDAEPTELRHDIETTRRRLDGVMDALSRRFGSAMQHSRPAYVLRHHPLAVGMVACGIALGVLVAMRFDTWSTRRNRRRRGLVIQLGGRRA